MTENVNYKAYVGPQENYDVMSAIQFIRLFQLGLRETSTVLEIGAGSLRVARILIPFLQPDRYYGVEPLRDVVEKGFQHELGRDIVAIKRPKFAYNYNFDFSDLGLPGEGVDFCLAQSIFSHTSRAQMEQAVTNVSKVLKGIFLATYVKGRKDYDGNTWVYPECVRFTWETVQTIAGRNGLYVRAFNWIHPHDQTWIAFSKNKTQLDEIVEADEALINQYVNTINELRSRIDRVKRILPAWLRYFIKYLR